jgi:hypothetical protein
MELCEDQSRVEQKIQFAFECLRCGSWRERAFVMSLISLNIEPTLFKRLLLVLERIASALEREYPDTTIRRGPPAGPENLTVFDPEKEFDIEQEEERLRQAGF